MSQRVFALIAGYLLPKPQLGAYPVVPLNITELYDNQAASLDGSGPANFDGRGGTFPAHLLPTRHVNYDGLHYHLPERWGYENDNVLADGQTVKLPKVASVNALHVLYAGDWSDGESGDRFKLEFEDGSTEEVEMSSKNWWTGHWLNVGAVPVPYHYEEGGKMNFNLTQIHSWSTPVRSSVGLRSITLPSTRNSWNRVHIFALSVTPSLTSSEPDADKPLLVVRRVRFTRKRSAAGHQLVEVTLSNLLPAGDDGWLLGKHAVAVSSSLVDTVDAGIVYRLTPADEVRVEVAVAPKKGVKPGATGAATIELRDAAGRVVAVSKGWTASVPEETWEPTEKSLSQHEAPNWWNDAKFGIFIHWGVFSVPAWAPPGVYAEWYDWHMHNPADDRNSFWRHHLETYGKDKIYEDFIPEFTASKFNASAWVELFDNAGAKYFVLTTKHHDGFALFDTEQSSHRSSYHLGPRRDLLRELFDAARNERPQLHRGTYFTMPEWFNPDAGPYGFGNWPGQPARHPFKPNEFEPFTGHLPVDDYLRDVQLAQMQILAERYGTEIMWCDIGGPNLTLTFAADFYNQAQREGREVTLNNRCGAVPDFDTPEYARFSSVQTHHWETSEGIDPFSYGLNKETKPDDYRSAETIIHSLVDIASKNGNYLLNVGPTAEGEIIAPMVERLLEVGQWLRHSGDCVYGTTYWSRGGEAGSARFLTTPTTFCAVVLERPRDGLVTIERVLPLRPGDEVRLLGAGGRSLKWWIDEEKERTYIKVRKGEVDKIQHAWAFQATYADAL
ncbi:glycoside hydrolase [Auricularia subglabra TFB-10046 SS5]|nr:glycoside hydrolase [Auricularia subglabra TFB-10046 SS5]